MNPRPDPKYASAARPVNRRTAPREAIPPQPAPVRVQQQLLSTQARQLLGAPLARQLGQQSSHRSGTPLGPHHAVLALAPLAIVAGAWIAWQHSHISGLAVGGAMVVAGAAALMWALRARRRAQPLAGAAPAGPVFDVQALARLDRVLELLAPDVPADTLARLVGIKSTLVRMAPLLATATANEHFTVDDRLYIAECVRRYLPDSLQGWLQVPAHLRASGSPTPQMLLDEQLGLLQTELTRREQKLGRGAAEQLLQQQRFLKAKHGGS